MRKGFWFPDEDEKLKNCIATHLSGSWSEIARKAGLHRCGKSCRRRWLNHLRPDLKRGKEEIRSVIKLHKHFGNKWSQIAARLVGKTDNDVKNLWNTQIKRQLRLRQISDDAMISNALPSYKSSRTTFPFSLESVHNVEKLQQSQLYSHMSNPTHTDTIIIDNISMRDDALISNALPSYKSSRTTFPFSLENVHNVEKLQQSQLFSHMSNPTHIDTINIDNHSWLPINSSSNGCLIKSTQLPILSEALLNTSLYNCFYERMSNASDDKPTIYEFQKQQILHDHGMFGDYATATQLDLEHMDNLEEAMDVLPIELGVKDLSTTAMDNFEEAMNVLPIELGMEDLSTTASEGTGEDTRCANMGHPCYFDHNLYPIIAHGKEEEEDNDDDGDVCRGVHWSIELTHCDDWHHETLLVECSPNLNVL